MSLLALANAPPGETATGPLHVTVRGSSQPGPATRLNVVSNSSLDVTLTADVNGTGPIDYAWTLGDGSTGDTATVTHTFAPDCIYHISLHAVDSIGNDFWGAVVLVAYRSASPTGAIVVCPADGTAGFTPVEVAGSFFNPLEPVQVMLAGAPVANVTSDKGGSWIYNLTGHLSEEPSGFVYHFSTAPPSMQQDFTTLPAVRAHPDSGVSGDAFTLQGLSYPAGQTVTVYLGGVALGQAQADASGSFLAHLQVPFASPLTQVGSYPFTTLPAIGGQLAYFRITANSQPPSPPSSYPWPLLAAVVLVAAAVTGYFILEIRRRRAHAAEKGSLEPSASTSLGHVLINRRHSKLLGP